MQEAMGPLGAGGYSCDYNGAFVTSVMDRIGQEKGLQTQAKDLATFESEYFRVDPIGNYTLQVKQAQFLDKASGSLRDELTLVDTIAEEPMGVWTDAGEHGTGTKEEYSRLITWAHELAEKEGEATLSWMSRGQKREDGKPEHRFFVLKKKNDGHVEASMYSLTGSENALSSMMERLGFEQSDSKRPMEERRLLTEGRTSNFSHVSIFDAYTSSLSRKETRDHAEYIDHFRREAIEVSDPIRQARIAHRQELFEKTLAESDQPLQEALGIIVQGFTAIPRIVSENGYVPVDRSKRNEDNQMIAPLPVSIERETTEAREIQSFEHAAAEKREDRYKKVPNVDERSSVGKTKREQSGRIILLEKKQTIQSFEKRNIQDTISGNEHEDIKTGFGLEAFAMLHLGKSLSEPPGLNKQIEIDENLFSNDAWKDRVEIVNFIQQERDVLVPASDNEHVIPSALFIVEAIQILGISLFENERGEDVFLAQFIENSPQEFQLIHEDEEVLFALGKDILNFMETENNRKILQILLEISSHSDLADEIHHILASLLYREILQISMNRKDDLPIELAQKIEEMKDEGGIFEQIGGEIDDKVQTFMGATGEIMKEITEVTPTDIIVAIATATVNTEGSNSEIPTREKMTQLTLKKIIVARKLIEVIHTGERKDTPFILSGELMENNPLYLDISLILLLEHLDISIEIKDRLLQSLGIKLERLYQLISQYPEKIQNIPVSQIKTVFEQMMWLRSQQNFKSFTRVFSKTKKKSSQNNLPLSMILFQYNTFRYE